MVFVDSLLDAIIDCLKVAPILLLAYLLVSLLSHDHSRKFTRFLAKNRKTSVLYASFLGCVPQCGFSSVIADLYSRRHVSLGTLIAVFVATSDEAIPIMISNTDRIVDLLLLIGIKIALAIVWGYGIDLVLKMFKERKKKSRVAEQRYRHSIRNHECGHVHTDECGNKCGHNHGDCCANNIFIDALMHTFNILLYIFIATFVINLIIGFCGMGALQNLLTDNVYDQIIIASIIGLIPNCASSVLLVELFLEVNPVTMLPMLQFPALIAGLTTGAGVGMFILFSKNRSRMWENFAILFTQYAIGVLSGILLTVFF